MRSINVISPLLTNVRHRAMITPVSPLLTRLFHISLSYWKIIVRLKLLSEWELSVGLDFKSNFLYNTLLQKTFSLI